MQSSSDLIDLMSDRMSFGQFSLVLLSHYIIFAHLMGGVLLVLGLLTRFASLIQIPILLGAIIFVNASPVMMRPLSELLVSIMVLLLLLYFLVVGNGPWSFENFTERQQ